MHTSTSNLPLEQGSWVIDPTHSTVEFTARHLGISKVRGRFRKFDAELSVGDDLDATRLRAVIDLSSVETDNADRDAHLRNSDFFDVDRRPEMLFESDAITETEPNHYLVSGRLTLNGVSRPQELVATFNGTETYPVDGSVHAGFEARGTIDRTDYGIDFNVPLGAGGFVISNKIGIELDVQLRTATQPACV
jgi:polyisoprenoid-binding protein YceI